MPHTVWILVLWISIHKLLSRKRRFHKTSMAISEVKTEGIQRTWSGPGGTHPHPRQQIRTRSLGTWKAWAVISLPLRYLGYVPFWGSVSLSAKKKKKKKCWTSWALLCQRAQRSLISKFTCMHHFAARWWPQHPYSDFTHQSSCMSLDASYKGKGSGTGFDFHRIHNSPLETAPQKETGSCQR